METNTAVNAFLKGYSASMKSPIRIISSVVQRQKDEHINTLKREDIDCIRCTVESMEQALDSLRLHLQTN